MTNTFYRKLALFSLVAIIFILAVPVENLQAQDTLPNIENYYFHSSWGGDGKQLLRPEDVSVTSDGKIYILNSEFNRVTIIDQEGYIYNEIGGFGEEDGEFNLPLSIAINESGEIYISDTWNRRMQKFDSEGNHLLTFGDYVDGGEGEVFAPRGIAFDTSGNLLIADMNKIIKFSPNGDYITEWGNLGTGDGQFDHPSDVAIDEHKNIYVADNYNHRVQIFTENGIYLDEFTIIDDETGTEANPQGLAIDDFGLLYVTANDKVFIYDINNSFALVETWGGSGQDLGQLDNPSGIFIEPSTGDIFVAETVNNRVSVFHNNGNIKTAYGTSEMVDGYFYYPLDAVVANDIVYVTDSSNSRIQVFNKDGNFIFKWGEFGNGDGQFNGPWGIDADNEGNLFVADSNNKRLQKFNSNGDYIDQIAIPLDDKTIECKPKGIAIDKTDNTVYVTISDINGNNRIQKYTSDLTFQKQWEGGGSSISIDSSGNVYTLRNNYVEVFTNEGEFVRKWGEGPGIYKGLRGLAIDKFDDVYVMDLWNGFIKKYSNDGTLLGTFGQQGNGPGEFAYGSDMEITEEGVLYVVDGENQRVQIIAPTLPEPDHDTGLILNGNFGGSEVAGRSGVLLKSMLRSISLSENRASVEGLNYWTYGGLLGISRSSTHTNESEYSLMLGDIVNTIGAQGISEGWAYQSFYVRPEWIDPVLTFNYNVFTNDNLEKSNFIVEIQDGVGLNNLDTIVLEGYIGNTPEEIPSPGTDLGWKKVEYDLSPYRGKHIRLSFSSRNLYPDSLGVWSYVEKVEVKDSAIKYYLPIVNR